MKLLICCVVMVMYLQCTQFLLAHRNLKGDPEQYEQDSIEPTENLLNKEQEEVELELDLYDQLEKEVKKNAQNLYLPKQVQKKTSEENLRGDPEENQKVSRNYPVSVHHREKRFLKGIVKGISKGIKGIGGFVKGAVGGVLGIIPGLFMGRGQAEGAAAHYDQSMRFSLLQLCTQICVTEWSMWSSCNQPCGGGSRTRSRKNQLPGQCSSLKDFKCSKSLEQTENCNEGCPNGGISIEGGCECAAGWLGICCHQEATCDFPGKPAHGKIRGTFPARYRAVAQFECNPGWALIGDDSMHCKENGQWQGSKPTCKRLVCPPDTPNANVVILNQKPQYYFGETLIYRCKEGHVMEGPSIRRCQSFDGITGSWDGFSPMCSAVTCEDPGFPDEGDRLGSDLTYGGELTFNCPEGYKMMGSKTMKCLASGTWLGRVPSCEQIECDAPFVPKNGYYQLRKSVVGAIVSFECDEGFSLQGNTTLKCMDDGYWNGHTPKCKAIKCPNPGIPEKGSKDGSSYSYPKSVTYKCYNGYQLKGATEIQCQIDGTWSNSKPTCQACPLGTYMDEARMPGKCLPCGDNMHTTTEGSTAKQHCICDDGFSGPPGGPCIKIECPALSVPVHGSKGECPVDLGSECVFTCDNGYVLDKGSAIRTCQGNGQWSGTEPVCGACPENTYKSDVKKCLPCPDNSYTNETTGNMLEGCVCLPGYEGSPGGPCNDVNECLENDGRGPCSQTCTDIEGSYLCGCSIEGYEIDEDQHSCKLMHTCKNLTRDEAPLNGGLVCHWYYEQNSQQCGVRCNKGYEFPSRVNNYEVCGPVTGYTWSFRREDAEAIIQPCIEQFYPDMIIETATFYFVRDCDDLTAEEQDDVKQQFIDILNENKICEARSSKVCDISNVGIICGHKQYRRKKRGVMETLNSVEFNVNITSLKEETAATCDSICKRLKIPPSHCDSLCEPAYRRFLKLSVERAALQLKKMSQNERKLREMNFYAAHREFEAEPNGVVTSEMKSNCPEGMEWVEDLCVPCAAGSYFNKDTLSCTHCPRGTYQVLKNQTYCENCPLGTTSVATSNITGPTFCLACEDDRWGPLCEHTCGCIHGFCNPTNGECVCESGWTGEKCNQDIPGCLEGSCYEGVQCHDVPAPGTGFSCELCPPGYYGDGATCTKNKQLASSVIAAANVIS